MKRFIWGLGLVALISTAFAQSATDTGLTVMNNAALQAISTPLPIGRSIQRLGFLLPGDGGAAVYQFQASQCAAPDNGMQVQPMQGGVAQPGCFVLQATGGPEDARIWGAFPDDGITHPDAGAAINAACAAYNNVRIPITPNGFYVKTPIVCTNGRLQGQLAAAINPYPATGFPNQSFLNCDSSVAACLTIGSTNAVAITEPLQVSDLIVSYNTTPAPSGATAVSVLNSYNVTLDNVHVYNADTCMLIKGNGVSGSNLTLINVGVDRCQSHWYVFDQWNGVTFLGGNDGTNAFSGAGGGPEYTGSQDVYEFTASTGGASYQGPNTITMTNHTYVNSAGGAACLFNWANFNPTTPDFSTVGGGLRVSHSHFEQHGFVGTARGTICSDSSDPVIPTVGLIDDSFDMGTTSFGFFALNSVTALKQWRISDTALGGCGNVTAAPIPISGPSFSDVTFSDNFGCTSASFTSNSVGQNTLYLRGNNWGTLTIGGSWNLLSGMADKYSALTDNATGNVAWVNPVSISFSPVLMCGATACSALGSPWTVSYPVAFAYRDGTGFDVSVNVTVSVKGTASGAAMSIAGLPYTCSSSYTSSSPFVAISGMTASDIPDAIAQIGGASSTIFMYTLAPTGTGLVAMTDAAFTASSLLRLSLHCGKTS